jgi:hypothetical protein
MGEKSLIVPCKDEQCSHLMQVFKIQSFFCAHFFCLFSFYIAVFIQLATLIFYYHGITVSLLNGCMITCGVAVLWLTFVTVICGFSLPKALTFSGTASDSQMGNCFSSSLAMWPVCVWGWGCCYSLYPCPLPEKDWSENFPRQFSKRSWNEQVRMWAWNNDLSLDSWDSQPESNPQGSIAERRGRQENQWLGTGREERNEPDNIQIP